MRHFSTLSILSMLACGPATEETPPDTDTDTDTDITITQGQDGLVPAGDLKPGGGIVHIMDMDIHGGDAFLAAYIGLIRLDVSEPDAMRKIASPGEQKLYWTDLTDQHLLASGRENGVRRIDFSEDGSWSPGPKYQPDGVYTEGVSADDTHAFIAEQARGVTIADLSTMSAVANITAATNAIDTLIHGDLLLILDRDQGLIAVDVSNRLAPAVLSSTPLPSSPHQLLVHGDWVYVAATSNLLAIDISEPSAPSIQATVPTFGLAQRLDRSGNLLAVANWHDTRVYDITEPGNPVLFALESATDASMSVDIEENTLFVGDWDVVRSYTIVPEAKGPEITFDSNLKATGDASEVTAKLYLRNDGTEWLQVDDMDCDSNLRTEPASVLLGPSENATLTAIAESLGSQEQILQCTFNTNDGDEQSTGYTLVINPNGLAVGDKAPDWTLSDLDDQLHTLSSHLGKPVMISIFSSL
jgi:hypothetical protein